MFRKHETFSATFHLSLLLLPPTLCVALLFPALTLPYVTLLSFGTYLSTLTLSLLAYRASPFHPLARYPGPFGCRLSKFWMAIVGFRGDQYLYVKCLHERYGDIVRTGPNELSLRDPSLLNDIYGASGLPHGPMHIGRTLTYTNVPLVGILDTAEHLERRKPWTRAFTPAALKEYQPMLAARATQLVDALGRQAGEIDISKWVNYFSYDFMSDMVFGGGSELLRDGDVQNIWRLLDDGLRGSTFISHVPWLGPYVGRIPAVSSAQAQMIAYTKQLVLQRLRRGTALKDLFHYLNEEDRPENPAPPLSRLIHEGILAVVAGADTTSSALTSIFFCLLTHPDAYMRLQTEIDRFYPAGEDPCDLQQHADMHYLTAVINEGMRVWPPVPSGVQRLVPHDGPGVTCGTIYFPPGTAVQLHSHSIQHDPRNFSPRTTEFWPERWLLAAGRASFTETGIDEASFVHNETAFAPFSHGPMNCVGKGLAMQEMRVVLCAVLQRYELRLRAGWDPRAYGEGYKDYFVTTRPAVPVTVHAR
ncbi:high nitrogen upregulated cytochrome P450 monooxygenase 2 [Lenzites betulinus]|nr:high nitrogen upregulated cytochrome P450 monooxygenase 2 [Lenzites betulinus]